MCLVINHKEKNDIVTDIELIDRSIVLLLHLDDVKKCNLMYIKKNKINKRNNLDFGSRQW